MKSERPCLNPNDFKRSVLKIVHQSKSRNRLTEPGLMKLCKYGYPPRANCRDCLDSIPPKNIYICKYQ